MKKLFSISVLLAFLVGMVLGTMSCAGSKSKVSAKRELSKDSVSVAHSESTEVKLKDNSSLVKIESRTITTYDDFIDATMALDLNEVDSLESLGIKVVAKLEPTASGSYKLRIKATAKPNRLEEVFTSTGSSTVSESNVSANNSKDIALVKTETKEATKDTKKKYLDKCLGGCGSYSAQRSDLVHTDCIKVGILINQYETSNQSITEGRNLCKSGRMAENLRFADNRFGSGQVFLSRHRCQTKARHLRLQGVGSCGAFDSLNGCLQG